MTLAALTAAAVVATTPSPASEPLDPVAFFEGATRGVGTLHVRGRNRQRFTVTGRGEREPGGAVRLSQAIRWEDGRVDRRVCRMWRVGPGEWRGRGTDMLGEGRAEAVGDTVVLTWRRAGGPFGGPLTVTQVLRRRADGGLDNAGPVRLWGVTVARLEERIMRVEGP